MDGAVPDGGVHGAFGGDYPLFEAQESGEIGGGGLSYGYRHGAKVRKAAGTGRAGTAIDPALEFITDLRFWRGAHRYEIAEDQVLLMAVHDFPIFFTVEAVDHPGDDLLPFCCGTGTGVRAEVTPVTGMLVEVLAGVEVFEGIAGVFSGNAVDVGLDRSDEFGAAGRETDQRQKDAELFHSTEFLSE